MHPCLSCCYMYTWYAALQNWLAIFIVISLVLYHIILADPKLR